MSRSVENGAVMTGGDKKSRGVQCRGDRHMEPSGQTHGAERTDTWGGVQPVWLEGPIVFASAEDLLPAFLRGWCLHVP